MTQLRLRQLGVFLAAGVVAATVGCREQPPTDRHNTNLGTSDRLLLPTVNPQFDAATLTGRATIVPLQDVSAAKAAEEAAADDETAILATIEKFQLAFRANDQAAIVPMLVERQREKAAATASIEGETSELVAQVLEAMKQSLPALFQVVGTQLESMMNVEFDLDELTVDGDRASVSLAVAGAPPMQFEKVDGEWFLALPESPGDVDAAVQRVTTVKKAFQSILDILQDDALSEQERTQRVMAAFGAMAATPPTFR